MAILFRTLSRVTGSLHLLAGIILALIMLLTAADVVLRAVFRPIVGTWEIVSFASAVVFGFALPYTSKKKGHIFVEFWVQRFSARTQMLIRLITRIVAMALFLTIGWNFIGMGMDLYTAREVSATLRLPFYPILWGLAFSCFIESLVLMEEAIPLLRGTHE